MCGAGSAAGGQQRGLGPRQPAAGDALAASRTLFSPLFCPLVELTRPGCRLIYNNSRYMRLASTAKSCQRQGGGGGWGEGQGYWVAVLPLLATGIYGRAAHQQAGTGGQANRGLQMARVSACMQACAQWGHGKDGAWKGWSAVGCLLVDMLVRVAVGGWMQLGARAAAIETVPEVRCGRRAVEQCGGLGPHTST